MAALISEKLLTALPLSAFCFPNCDGGIFQSPEMCGRKMAEEIYSKCHSE
jgi:hypothetical protein